LSVADAVGDQGEPEALQEVGMHEQAVSPESDTNLVPGVTEDGRSLHSPPFFYRNPIGILDEGDNTNFPCGISISFPFHSSSFLNFYHQIRNKGNSV